MYTFEELIAIGGSGYAPGFDLATRERYMAKIESGGNNHADSLSIRTLESNLTAYSASVSHTIEITFKALPSVLFCSAAYFKGQKLKDGNGNKVPIAHIPSGTYCVINKRVYSVKVNDPNYCGSVIIDDPKNPIPRIIVAKTGVQLHAPDKALRKAHRKYLKTVLNMSKVHNLLNSFDVGIVRNSVKKYIKNHKVCIPPEETLEDFLDSPLAHIHHSTPPYSPLMLPPNGFSNKYADAVRGTGEQSWWNMKYYVSIFLNQIGKEVLPYHVEELYINTEEE